ncbi:MAG: HAD family hydrolase [Promethearchaeia archaeon]
MKEAIIFDFGFTLFYFKNASLKKYKKCFQKGLTEVINYLKEHNILSSERAEKKFRAIFKNFRRRYFSLTRETNREFSTQDLIFLVLNKLIELDLIDTSQNTIEQLKNKLASLFHSHEAKAWYPYGNTRTTLQEIKNNFHIKLAVLSNHPHHEMVHALLSRFNLLQFFDVIITSAKVGFRKPHKKIFHFTLGELGLKNRPQSCFICGDEYADIVGGIKAGLDTILYERRYKFPFEKEITGTNHTLIKDISEILDYI